MTSASFAPRVLVLEDHAESRLLAVKVLRRNGFRTLEADRAEGLSELVHAQRPDLILMDIELPGQSGCDAVRFLKSDPAIAAIPIIALTAYAMPEDRERCLHAGCDDYLSKPLDIHLLLETIRRHLID